MKHTEEQCREEMKRMKGAWGKDKESGRPEAGMEEERLVQKSLDQGEASEESGAEADYRELDALLDQAKAGDMDQMGALILRLDPLIKKQIRHYFGRTDEDLLQMGRLRAFELIQRFDPALTDVKFLGYMSRFLGCYFWDLKKQELRQASLVFVPVEEEELNQKALYDEAGFLEVEMEDLLGRLAQREAYVVRHHILLNKSLVQVAEELGMTRDQVRYLKKKAVDCLRQGGFR